MSDGDDCNDETWTFPDGPYVDAMDTHARREAQNLVGEVVNDFCDVDKSNFWIRILVCANFLAWEFTNRLTSNMWR